VIITETYKRRIQELAGVKKQPSNKSYFRAESSFVGNKVLFEPKGFYEGVDDQGGPKYKFDTFWVSDTPELAASKYIGGAILGASSMIRVGELFKTGAKVFVYEIKEKPDVDISHWGLQDFEWLEEVRYRRPVAGEYIGKFVVTKEFSDIIESFYKMMSLGDTEYPEEGSEEYEELINIQNMIESGKFRKMLKNIKVSK
jgi:hypothetical protein